MRGVRTWIVLTLALIFLVTAAAPAFGATWYGTVIGYSTLKVTARQDITYSTYYDGTFNYVKPYLMAGNWWCRDYVSSNQYHRASVPYCYQYLQLTGMRPNRTYYRDTLFQSGSRNTVRSYPDYATTLYKSSWYVYPDYVSTDSWSATGTECVIQAWSRGYIYNHLGAYVTYLQPYCRRSFGL